MVKLYCKKINRNDFDKHISTKDHECLDSLPRKTVGQQVEAFLLAGQNLEMSRRAMFELQDYDESKDIEEYDTGLDEYSDFFDYQEAQKELTEKVSKINAYRKEQAKKKKQEESVVKSEKVEKVEKEKEKE